MTFKRQLLEGAIERLIELLDDVDGDPDLEEDPIEEQHDAEAELSWASGTAPEWFVVAERARRKLPHRP
jgi:hypothetical protein